MSCTHKQPFQSAFCRPYDDALEDSACRLQSFALPSKPLEASDHKKHSAMIETVTGSIPLLTQIPAAAVTQARILWSSHDAPAIAHMLQTTDLCGLDLLA